MTKRRIIILALGVCLLAGLAAAVVLATGDRLDAKPRREWKDQAIARIERRLSDRQALNSGIGLATTRPAPDAWIGDGVLVMKNGEWIACESICSKEDRRVHDLFIGHGSDGNWYYSTFHFCRDMVVLRTEERQPHSLAEFADAFWLATFDGRSDECLKATWTGAEPWGSAKLEMSAAAKAAR